MKVYVVSCGTYGDVEIVAVRTSIDGAREELEDRGEGQLSDDELGEIVEWDGQEDIEFNCYNPPIEGWYLGCKIFEATP